MSLQELRFFTIYLSKINPKDEKTRLVRFSLVDFQAIMGFTGRVHITYLKSVVDSLLMKVTGVPDERGTGVIRFQFFKKCRVSESDNGEWFVEIDAHDDALPLMFNFKSHYFKYELWNALRLKSKNQLRMYEVLKQHEKIGYRILSLETLKEQLGIDENEYLQYRDFKRDVLDVCQKALLKNTDISYTYEPHGKKGRGGKIVSLKFTITKNKNFVDPLSLDKFVQFQANDSIKVDGATSDKHSDAAATHAPQSLKSSNILHSGKDARLIPAKDKNTMYKKAYTTGKIENIKGENEIDFNDTDENGLLRATKTSPLYEERIALLRGACNNEFSREEIIVIYGIMAQMVPHVHFDETKSHNYLQQKYRELEMYHKQRPIRYRFRYLKKLVEIG